MQVILKQIKKSKLSPWFMPYFSKMAQLIGLLSEMNALTIEKLYKFSNKFDQVNQKKIQSIINTSILSR